MRIPISIFAFIAVTAGSCTLKNTEDPAKSGMTDSIAVPDTYFTNLFIRDCCGFTGGDGTYSVLLPDGRTVWIFGDTFLGTVLRSRQHGIGILN